MVDHVSAEKRSEIMSRVKQTGSKAEMVVRRLVWGMGYRYRLNVRLLPGSPDLVFSKKRRVVFVHGCFWHGHIACSKAALPKSNCEYWAGKISGNAKRDETVQRRLTELGWRVLVLWQCELKDTAALQERLKKFLDAP